MDICRRCTWTVYIAICLSHFVLIDVCSAEFLVVCSRICTGFTGVSFRETHLWEHFGRTDKIALIMCLKKLNVSGASLNLDEHLDVEFIMVMVLCSPPKKAFKHWDEHLDVNPDVHLDVQFIMVIVLGLFLKQTGEIQKGTDRKCHKMSWRLSQIVVTYYDNLWRFMSMEQRDGNCHKMPPRPGPWVSTWDFLIHFDVFHYGDISHNGKFKLQTWPLAAQSLLIRKNVRPCAADTLLKPNQMHHLGSATLSQPKLFRNEGASLLESTLFPFIIIN